MRKVRWMDVVMAGLSAPAFWAAMAITGFAGFVKGAVGFAMPMIMISAFSSFLSPELALAGLILPTLFTNLSQAFRQGAAAAADTAFTYRRFLSATVICIAISAPFVAAIPQPLFLMLLGLPITAFAALQLSGLSLALQLQYRIRAEWALGVISGLYGGVSGVWGPPLLVYLLSTKASKSETVLAQGVVFLIGAVALLAAHLVTGVANGPSMAFSATLTVAGMIGLHLGYRLQDRLDQHRFRRWTQTLLVLTGLNLIRRSLGL